MRLWATRRPGSQWRQCHHQGTDPQGPVITKQLLLHPTTRPQGQKPNLTVSVLHCGIARVRGDTLKYFLDGEKIRREERKGRRDGGERANSRKPPLQEVAHTEGKLWGFRMLLSVRQFREQGRHVWSLWPSLRAWRTLMHRTGIKKRSWWLLGGPQHLSSEGALQYSRLSSA